MAENETAARCTRDWRELCKAASQEHDPQKLLELVSELNDALAQPSVPRPVELAPDQSTPARVVP